MTLSPLEPILIAHRFGPIHHELLALLRSLSPVDWSAPTVAAGWTVHDMVAHLLDTDIRRLSMGRDQLTPPRPHHAIESPRDLVDFLDLLNVQWVTAARRISPPLLIDFHALVGPQLAAWMVSLDPFARTGTGVAWAGETRSLVWFDTAREYTEKWMHQQQIRDAVAAPGLVSREWLHPVLDTFVRGLPHRYRNVLAAEGTSISLRIEGDAGDEWTLVRAERWQLFHGIALQATATVHMDQDTAWRLFTKGIDLSTARAQTRIAGDFALGEPMLSLVAIMANE
jgi:uncharacterized protein (TIGR03083 family)